MDATGVIRILIVEDDPGTALLHKRSVERAGYQATTAATVEDAIQAIRDGPVHLILLDNRLPDQTTGFDFLSRLQALAPEIPVIMVTGSGTENAVIHALRRGARDFIRKDRNYLQNLPRAISAVLASARLEAQLESERPVSENIVLILNEGGADSERQLLQRAGFQVLIAKSSEQALALLAEHDVRVLVADLNISPISGLEAYQLIKAAGHDLRAVMVSDGLAEDLVIEAMRAGFVDFIVRNGDYSTRLRESLDRVTARVALERRLAESRARLAGIISSALDAILLLDDQHSVSMFNPAAEQLFGVRADEARGKPVAQFIPGFNAVRFEPEAAREGTLEQRARVAEAAGRTAAGKRLELELSTSRMDVEGRKFVTVIARDVTERKELERLLLQKDKLESLGLLAGGIAHDFNNLLVGIMGNASLALETISTNNPARSMLRDVMVASETAANLTRQLLAYAGKGRFVTEAVDLSDLVQQISTLLQTSIPKNVQLRFSLAEKLPCVEADTAQMQQILMNLVINAAEAIGEAQGTVLITTGVQQVDEDYIATVLAPAVIMPGEYVTLEVHDSGAGMNHETLEKIFDPFFTTKSTGRGLGLAAVLGIVRGHKGAVKVYSTPGQGTTFKLLFPATEDQAARPVTQTITHAASEGETVLVVDDEQIVRRSAKTMLERFGYSVVLAENGKEAVDLYRILADKIDVVLLDMTMPIMNGEQAFRELKTIRPDVRVILSSGYNEGEAVRRFAGKGLAGFIQKPYSANTLAQKVRAVLSESYGSGVQRAESGQE
jgi:PAS domain S-box-containing protein